MLCLCFICGFVMARPLQTCDVASIRLRAKVPAVVLDAARLAASIEEEITEEMMWAENIVQVGFHSVPGVNAALVGMSAGDRKVVSTSAMGMHLEYVLEVKKTRKATCRHQEL
ncbi:MAG: uncharacterized protein KVP18_003299 [Porospora cf. gigantea A]|uniref:uncharacterized protein n=1 Tax=Porospora cf. gigantea A TaxID=2853593 RepID=UPI00355A5DB2|nr:MAG: hypothetical protein KVP18_003299 [Porospora cf. gigantea A]